MGVEITTAAADFQADDEGSIPFTRSKSFQLLRHVSKFLTFGFRLGLGAKFRLLASFRSFHVSSGARNLAGALPPR